MKKNQKINQQDVLNGIEVLKNACVTYKGMKKRAENQSANTGKQPTNTAQQPAKAQPGAKPEKAGHPLCGLLPFLGHQQEGL